MVKQSCVNYLQILKETLRMYSPAFGIIKSSAPGGIVLNGYYIPEGIQISVFCYNMYL